jgi:hypothetical protein
MIQKSACNKSLVETRAKIQTLKSNIDICNIEINRYYSSNDLCGEERARKDALRIETVLTYQECTKALDICQESLVALITKYNFTDEKKTEWDRTHFECAYEPYIARSNAEIEEILRWCKLDVDKTVKYENAYITSYQEMINIKGDDLVACTTGENTLPVVPPKQPPPGSLETAGTPGPAPAPVPAPTLPKVELYEHHNYGGQVYSQTGRYHPYMVIQFTNDGWGKQHPNSHHKGIVSSLKVWPRTRVQLFYHANDTRTFDNHSFTDILHVPELSSYSFNDATEWFDIHCLGWYTPAC